MCLEPSKLLIPKIGMIEIVGVSTGYKTNERKLYCKSIINKTKSGEIIRKTAK